MDAQFEDEQYQAMAQCVEAGDVRRLEDLWLDVCGEPQADLPALCRIADIVADKGQPDRAGTLLKMLLPPLGERDEQGRGVEIVQRIARYARDPEEARAFAMVAYTKATAGRPDIAAALEISGVRGGAPLKEAIEQLDALLFLDRGDFVFHDGGWGVGQIAEADIAGQCVVVDFERKPGHRVSSQMAPKILRKLEPDDFEALRWKDISRLRDMAASDPAALLRSVLRSAGRKLSTKEIRTRLAAVVVDPEQWGKWWASARRRAQKDACIEADGQKFGLRAEAITPEQEALRDTRAAGTAVRRLAVAYGFLRKSDASDRSAEALTEMAALIAQTGAESQALPERIEAAFLAEDLVQAGADAPEGGIPPAAEMLAGVEDVRAVINGMTRGEYQRRALRIIRENRPEQWPGIYEELLFHSPRDLWDFIVRELMDAGHGAIASAACLRVANDHYAHAELYLWLCRHVFAGRFEAILGDHDEFVLLENLLSLLDELADPRRPAMAQAKRLLGRGKDVLGMKNFAHLERIATGCTPDEARRIRDMVTYNRGISDSTRRSVNTVLMQVHSSLFERAAPKEEDLPIYTTPAGLKKVQDEYGHLMNVQIPGNQKALGAAIAFGDVSDNAELRAAREEQASLASRADHLAMQLRRVQVLNPKFINTSQVCAGTQVTVRNLGTGGEETYIILGPWDADPERGVISHLAPLAQSLLGKSVGGQAVAHLADEVRNYEISGITQASW